MYKFAAVIVETRPIANIEYIIKRHLCKLNNEWELFIFHGDKNAHLFDRLQAKKFNIHNIGLKEYNRLLTSAGFWHQIPHEKILIFQHDSMLLKKDIEKFLEWDFVGAPLKDGKQNGGLSIRSKNIMLKAIKRYNYRSGNEDIFFCSMIPRIGGKMAPLSVAQEFSCESIFRLNTYGYHGINKWLNSSQCRMIATQYISML